MPLFYCFVNLRQIGTNLRQIWDTSATHDIFKSDTLFVHAGVVLTCEKNASYT